MKEYNLIGGSDVATFYFKDDTEALSFIDKNMNILNMNACFNDCFEYTLKDADRVVKTITF